ncbi:MAG: flavodoxin [Acholeplasmataceae bacterium]|nr:flavodoxin [Acholeplasmataceae bacterium]
MKTAIIIYSKTGNTRGVAKRLETQLKAMNKDVDLLEVVAASDDPNVVDVKLVDVPDIAGYDQLIFASPVHAFSLSKIMSTYLWQLETLEKKDVKLFVTHFFPFAWMGGNRTLKQMKSIVERKLGLVSDVVSINWKSKKREHVIEDMISRWSN